LNTRQVVETDAVSSLTSTVVEYNSFSLITDRYTDADKKVHITHKNQEKMLLASQ